MRHHDDALADASGADGFGDLPRDVWHLIVYEHARVVDVVTLSCVSRELNRLATAPSVWAQRLEEAASNALGSIANPRSIDYDHVLHVAHTVKLAKKMAGVLSEDAQPTPNDIDSRILFFRCIQYVARAAVSILSKLAPRLCLLSFDQRAYDTTEFVQRHPGGAYHMQRHHGRDATHIFDAFPHSHIAHDMMEKDFLRFDAIAFVGRFGAPFLARTALAHGKFSLDAVRNGVADFAGQIWNELGLGSALGRIRLRR